jgi:hypothetical protein
MRLLVFLFLLFLAVPVHADTGAPPSPGDGGGLSTISGQVMIDAATPMSFGVVLLYDGKSGPPPALGRYWRVPDLITPLEKEGKFTLEVSEGTYYLQVAQKNPGSEVGPAVENEYLYFHGDKEGNALPLVVGPGTQHRLGQLKAFLWSPEMVRRDKGITSVEGVVEDTDGKPVARAVVLAYYNPTGNGRPIFVSDRTDAKGRYQLRTNDGGTFYLKVRSVIGGGKPASGEYLNTTKEFTPVEVTLKRGERRQGVALKVMKLQRPADMDQVPDGKREWRLMKQAP